VDVLDGSWITVQTKGGIGRVGLAQLLADLTLDRVEELPRLRPHQEAPVYMLLAQLAGMVDARGGLPQTVDGWDRALRSLSEGHPTAWLAVADRSNPAFLQPAMSGLDPKRISTPDALDILVSAKNHDIKRGVCTPSDIELWLYALITLQTAQGFSGAGCYGIARMNGGYGNRPYVDVTGELRWGAKMLVDVVRMRSLRPSALARIGTRRTQPLLWLAPWNGRTSLEVVDIDPWAIEVCRQVRLERAEEGFVAFAITSVVPRIDAAHLRGDMADPWAPVVDGSVLTIGSGGFHARTVSAILRFAPSGATVRATALARGQGKTEGFHTRTITLPSATEAQRAELAARLDVWLDLWKKLRSRAVFPAIRCLGSGVDDLAVGWVARLGAQVDDAVLPWLWRSLEDPEGADRGFRAFLRDAAGEAVVQVCRSAPIPSGRRWTARLSAEITFRRASASLLERTPGELPWWGSDVWIALSSDRDHAPVDSLMAAIRFLPGTTLRMLQRGDPLVAADLWARSGLSDCYPDTPTEVVCGLIGALAVLGAWHARHAALGASMFSAEISEARLAQLLSARGVQLIARIKSVSRLLAARKTPVDVSQLISLVLSTGDLADDVRRGVISTYAAASKPRSEQ